MEKSQDLNIYDYAIIGGGLAGAIAFSEFSKNGKTILIDKRAQSLDPTKNFQAKIICKHSFTWMSEAPWENQSIFLRDHKKALYCSKDNDGLVDGSEFNTILGKVVNLPALINWYLEQGMSNNGELHYGKEIIHLNNSPELSSAELTLSDKSILKSKLVIIATGSSDFSLHKQVRLPIPETLNSISMDFHGDKEVLDANLSIDYMFQLHPQISHTGMLWMTRGNFFFNIGFISKESEIEMREKFLRILKKYKKIQPFFHNVEPQLEKITKKSFKFQRTSKTPISKFVANRVLIIGDAGGLLYPLYIEGILGAYVSSKLAKKAIDELNSKNLKYSEQNLKLYSDNLNHTLINPYLEAGVRGNSLFFHANDKPIFTVWDAYIQVIKNNSQVRQNIVTAFTFHDLCNYPVENDTWCGERIYHQLPLGKRIALTPAFLKQKLNHI